MIYKIIFILLPVLVLILFIVNILFAINKPDTEKESIYESGFIPLEGQTRKPISIEYFIIGIIFIVFDIELAVFYPWAVSLNYGYFIYLSGIIFFTILTIGFIYELAKGVLYFSANKKYL